MLAAWEAEREWCGVQFGLQYPPGAFTISDWGPCAPSQCLELPGTGWPESGAGTSVVTSGTPWQGNLRPVYLFAGYAYADGVVELIDRPDSPNDAVFSNCLAEEFPATCLGAIGFGSSAGLDCCPGAPPAPCACCLYDGSCFVSSDEECQAQGGVWHPGALCEEVACPRPAVCCVLDVCHLVHEEECQELDGVWQADLDSCDPDPCEFGPAVCCVGDFCYLVWEGACEDLGGVWHPEWEDCLTNPCETGGEPDDLIGGVLICHAPAGLEYSSDPPPGGWCSHCELTSCEDARNDEIEGPASVWFVVAAWAGPREWCGVEFGLELDPATYTLTDWGPCAPSEVLELSSPAWPAPGTGTAIVVTGTPWEGNFLPVYWFCGYAYAPGVVLLTDNPETTGATTFANCEMEESDAACWGAIGFGQGSWGLDCCPPPPADEWVCCFFHDCVILQEDDCLNQGGEFHPEFGDCDDNPCDDVVSVQSYATAVVIEQARFGIDLTWQAHCGAGVLTYAVRRSTVGASAPGPAGEVLVRLEPLCDGPMHFRDERVVSGENYRYWLEATLANGERRLHGPWDIGVSGASGKPLLRCMPSPVIGEADLWLTLPRSGRVTLEIFSPMGSKVRTLREECLAAGVHRLTWDGRDEEGRYLPSGTYFYALGAGKELEKGRIVVVR